MARPPDPHRRAQTLAAATDYVLANGLTGLSLRPLARALQTSTRMLLYDFSSKEQLVAEILAEARRRQAALLEPLPAVGAAPADVLHAVWSWIAAAERVPYVRLFFEVYVDAIVNPAAYPQGADAMVTDWLGAAGRAMGTDPTDTATQTLVVAVVRGLLLDRLASGDAERTDAALATFTRLATAAQD